MWPRVLLCVSLPLLASGVVERSVPAQPGSALISCFQCSGTTSLCSKTCKGVHCYKTEMQSDGTISGSLGMHPGRIFNIKRGCVNYTDSSLLPGRCKPRTINLPGSTTTMTETQCLCQGQKCNLASQHFFIVAALFVLCIWLS